MKNKETLEIDLLEFFKSGKFDRLELGQTKTWILNNFLVPDFYDVEFLTEDINIWTYGGIELHFEHEILYLIFSDNWYEGKLKNTTKLKLNRWIFDDISKLDLLTVLTQLNKQDIDYKKKTDKLGVLLRLNSGIELTFENITDEEGLSPNQYHLTSFGLVAENPLRWK